MENLNDTWSNKYHALDHKYNEMQREFLSKENDWKKERALLEQQLEIQKSEILESKQREQNLKRMNETFLISISSENPTTNSQSRFIKDFQRSIESSNREAVDLKTKFQEHVQKLESRVTNSQIIVGQIRELEERLHEKELTLKDLANQNDKQLMQLQNQLIEAKSREELNEQKIQKLQADAKYRKDLNQFEHSAALRELQQQVQTLKGEHKKEVDRLKVTHEAELKKTKYQYAIKKSTSVDDSFTVKTPTQKPTLPTKQSATDLETRYKEERKRLKSQIMSYEVTSKQYKEKIERLNRQIQDSEHLQSEIRSLQAQITNLLRENNALSARCLEKQELESNLKCQLVELTTQLEEERLLNERLQQQRLQETASLGIKFAQEGTENKVVQSPCHPTARMRMQLSNAVNPRVDQSQLTLNPQGKLPSSNNQSKQAEGKENMPDVSHFSTNPASFKVQDLIQKAMIGDSQQSPLKENRCNNTREQQLQSELHTMLSKLYQAKKLITNTSTEESSYIRNSMMKIRSHKRSRNHSLSMNEQISELNISKDLDESKIPQYQLHTHYQSFLDDSMEMRRPSQTTNSFSICQFEENQHSNQPSRLKLKQAIAPVHPYQQQSKNAPNNLYFRSKISIYASMTFSMCCMIFCYCVLLKQMLPAKKEHPKLSLVVDFPSGESQSERDNTNTSRSSSGKDLNDYSECFLVGEELMAEVVTKKCGRPYMEDCFSAFPNFDGKRSQFFFAVYDGHGGSSVSRLLSKNLHSYLKMNQNFTTNMELAVMQSLGCEDLNTYILGQQTQNGRGGGSTALFAINVFNTLYVVNVGDSTCYSVSRSFKLTKLNKEHKPTLESESARIQQQGFIIYTKNVARIDGELAVSRSFGDINYVKSGLIAVPDITKTQISADDLYLLMATDGFWDVPPQHIPKLTSEDEVARLIAKWQHMSEGSMENLSQYLINHVTSKHTMYKKDNMTLLVADLRKYFQPDNQL